MRLKTFLAVIVIALLAVIGLVVASAQTTTPATTFDCTSDFEAGIRQGPDANFTVTGTLELKVADRVVTGALMLDNGSTIDVTGQVDGRALNLAFEVYGGNYMFGVGTATDDFSTCKAMAGGPLAGPQPGDIGDWGYGLGGKTPPGSGS